MFTSHNLRCHSWKAEQDTWTSQVKPKEKTETTDRETDSKVRGSNKKNTKRKQDTRQEKPAQNTHAHIDRQIDRKRGRVCVCGAIKRDRAR
jgi:hypothetical protein